MKLDNARSRIARLVWKFRLVTMFELLVGAAGVGLIAYRLFGYVNTNPVVLWPAALATCAVALFLGVRSSNLLRWNVLSMTLFINRNFETVKESSDLLVADQPLSGLQKVQLARVLHTVSEVLGKVSAPWRLTRALALLVAGGSVFFFLPQQLPAFREGSAEKTREEILVQPDPAKPPVVKTIDVSVTAPAYTGLPRRTYTNPRIKVPLNGTVQWTVTFEGEVKWPLMVFSDHDTIRLAPGKQGVFRTSRKVSEPGFYHFTWRDAAKNQYHSDFYPIEMIRDFPPRIEVSGLPQFMELGLEDSLITRVRATLQDDYGLSNAQIVATVSKGSGESVKFREEKLKFEKPDRFSGKRLTAERSIDILKLGLEPADELYFYIEAWDNMTPLANMARTETFFITFRDTARASVVVDSGLGVDFMPEYFRSQRQIIIDTEKLLSEQRKITANEFKSRSNELGYDQKTLRIRYGQFLGEEEEAGIGVEETTPDEATGEEEEEDPMKKLTHQHDTENEGGQLAGKPITLTADGHDDETKPPDGDPLKAFMHLHDTDQEASFFTQTVRTKLKAALTLMWDAELHLRMYEPKKSLPFQYRILALLKEISQDSRVYVHRTGFDPPPIKEERRLEGDLEEILSSSEQLDRPQFDSLVATRRVLVTVETMIQNGDTTTNTEVREQFHQAGYEVATAELKKPGAYIETLSILRRLADNRVPPSDLSSTIRIVRTNLWQLLPAKSSSPTKSRRSMNTLDRAFLKNLDRELRD